MENYLYFTLPMALNYQRNSYTLWKSALKTYNDVDTRFVFEPKQCLEKSFEEVQQALTKYKVTLQRQKQTEIRQYIQVENKKAFPYLSGVKICNYWLYVIYQYTDRQFCDLDKLTVAPDTHVCKATHRLGLITDEEFESSNVQQIVIRAWEELLENTEYKPIDVHTPLWLWSRNGFKEIK